MSAQELITDHLDLWTGAVTHKNGSGRSASGKNGKIELTGIKKLRELILELAVRGKLVEQDPSDEPASVLLERIAEEKARLVKEGKVKKPKNLPDIAEEEKPFELPWNWSWVRLGNISQINPRNGADDDLEASFIPMPLISTLYNGKHGQELRPWKEMKKGYTHIADGDIAIAKITPCFENSKAAIFNNLKNGIGAGTTELHVARPFGNTLDPCYVLLCLKSPRFLSNGERKMTGSAGQKRVPKDFFAGEPLPFAPLPEQHRIVEKVDELMALCDRLEQQVGDQLEAHKVLVDTLLDALTLSTDAAELAEHWARVAEHFDTLFTTEASIEKLKQTILQLAVMGRLVEQNSNDEPAIHLLNRYGIEGKTYFLPGWTKVALGNLGEILGGSTPNKSNAEFWEGDIPWVSPKDMKLPVIQDSQNKVTEQALQQTALKKVPKNSLLMVVRGMILAHSFPVAINGREVTINQDMKALVVPKEISPYLLLYLQAEKYKLVELVDRSSHGTCKLVSEKLWSHAINLPPIEEQARIIATVDELMTLCDRLKARLTEAGKIRAQLTETIVEQAVS